MTAVETQVTYNNVYTMHQEEMIYMNQEDSWDRDLLLDPAWEKQQRKVGSGRGSSTRALRYYAWLAHCPQIEG